MPVICHSCNFELYINTATGVGVIPVLPDGSILMIVRAKDPGMGKLDLPGGFVDRNESLEDTCRRELQEELGMELGELRYVGSHPNLYHYKGITYHIMDVFFESHLDREPDITLQEEEVSGVARIKPDEMNYEDLAFQSHRVIIKKYLDSLKEKFA